MSNAVKNEKKGEEEGGVRGRVRKRARKGRRVRQKGGQKMVLRTLIARSRTRAITPTTQESDRVAMASSALALFGWGPHAQFELAGIGRARSLQVWSRAKFQSIASNATSYSWGELKHAQKKGRVPPALKGWGKRYPLLTPCPHNFWVLRRLRERVARRAHGLTLPVERD